MLIFHATAWFAICAIITAQWVILLKAPPRYLPERINITLSPDHSVVFGGESLAALHADSRHLKLRRTPGGEWRLSNVSAAKKILLNRFGRQENVRSIEVALGMSLAIETHDLKVTRADRDLELVDAKGRKWDYDGAILLRDREPLPECPVERFGHRLTTVWNRYTVGLLRFDRPLVLGGNVFCDNRIALAKVDPGAVTIVRENGRFLLQYGSFDDYPSQVTIVHPASGFELSDLAQRDVNLEGVTAMVLGRTHFRIELAGDTLSLLPIHRVQSFTEPSTKSQSGIEMQWRAIDIWRVPSKVKWAVWAPLSLLAATLILVAARGNWPMNGTTTNGIGLVTALASLVATCGLVGYLAVRQFGVGWHIALLSLAAACWLAATRTRPRASLAATAGLLLLGIGSLVQLDLGLSANESHWIHIYQRSAAFAALGLGAGSVFQVFLRSNVIDSRFHAALRNGLLALAICAIAALLVQAIAGNETGVAGFQPVELAKLALAAFAAHALASRAEWQEHSRAYSELDLWSSYLVPVVLFLGLIVTALVVVKDYSPLVLLAFWAGGSLLAYAVAAGRFWIAVGAVSCAAAAVGLAAHWLAPNDLTQTFLDSGFYPERFSVWLEPQLHPHTGEQLRRGLEAIREGGWFGVRDAAQLAAGALRIPAVQDDFAPSWLIARWGLSLALALIGIQAAFVCTLLATGVQALAWSQGRSYQAAWAGRLAFFFLWGGAFLVLGHFVVSWGTNTGALPVMGQPMPFLSAAGSHLVLFLLPLLITSAIVAEETVS